jgi:hypothetical protein
VRSWLAVLIPLVLLPVAAGCNPPAELVQPGDLRVTRPGATTLVLVHSRSGHTARVARAVAEELGADLVRVTGKGGEGDSLWRTPLSGTRVEVHPAQVDLTAYRAVIVATPIWYWRPTALARSVVAASPVSGKRMVLLYTFEGGVSVRSLTSWAKELGGRGGRVIDVVGIDRRRLSAPGALEARAKQLARERRALWTGVFTAR